MLVSPILFTLAGLLLAGVSVPLIRRRVPPGSGYGLRVPATFADEWVWYEANARSGRDFLVFGLAFSALAAAAALAGLREPAYTAVMTAVLVAGVIAAAAVGSVRAGRLLRRRRAGETPSGR